MKIKLKNKNVIYFKDSLKLSKEVRKKIADSVVPSNEMGINTVPVPAKNGNISLN